MMILETIVEVDKGFYVRPSEVEAVLQVGDKTRIYMKSNKDAGDYYAVNATADQVYEAFKKCLWRFHFDEGASEPSKVEVIDDEQKGVTRECTE